jgi:hypothetical protein
MLVKFLKSWGSYNTNEEADFLEVKATELISLGVAIRADAPMFEQYAAQEQTDAETQAQAEIDAQAAEEIKALETPPVDRMMRRGQTNIRGR